uniref:Uncharacterized protein n=1 Tax=Melopsittacus undulatus TaxID=13146 RepID=A0A8V5G8L7_MELUD
LSPLLSKDRYYIHKIFSVIVLQAAFRGMKARKLYRQTKAICFVQSLWRMRKEKLRFLQLKKSVTTLQSHVRKYQQVKRYKEIKNAASVIQTWYRHQCFLYKQLFVAGRYENSWL